VLLRQRLSSSECGVMRPSCVQQLAQRHQRQPLHQNTMSGTPVLSTIERHGHCDAFVNCLPISSLDNRLRHSSMASQPKLSCSSALCPPAVEHIFSADPVACRAPRVPWRWRAQSIKSNYIHHEVNTCCPDQLIKSATNEH